MTTRHADRLRSQAKSMGVDSMTSIWWHNDPIADSAPTALDILLSDCKPTTLALRLGVHNVHIYRYINEGHVSPTLDKALQKQSFIPSEKRHRLHYEGGRGPEGNLRVERVRKFYIDAGFDNLTDWIDSLLEVE